MYILLNAFRDLLNSKLTEGIEVDSVVPLNDLNSCLITFLVVDGLFPLGVILEVAGDDELGYSVTVYVNANLPVGEDKLAADTAAAITEIIKETDYLELF